MKTALLAAMLSLFAPPAPAQANGDRIYSGSERQLAVDAPRFEEAGITLDGDLSEPFWSEAATLTNFTQLEPAEGASASERTEVLLFYTPQALYIGVRAYVSNPSRLRATLADRDKITQDDHIQILLDTFNDRRRAYALFVNPLGIQQDGIYSEASGRRREERTDFSPDFIFDSRGRVTAEGYVVEMRIPFKSLKFSSPKLQTWGINVIRRIAATGAEEAWAPLSRSNPSRLEQGGTIVGIRELRPGALIEINPTATGKREGEVQDDRFRHNGVESDLGVNLKYGVTSNLTLDATINPDFSQIEADAGQITTNERFAISFPEKRPFFLEGAEIFATPEPLVYTRAIVDPAGGAKLTGKVGAISIGYLGAVDESPLNGGTTSYSPTPERAIFNIARLQRDIGTGTSVGMLLTDREAGDEYNRVASVDARTRLRSVYTWQAQLAGAQTRVWRQDTGGADTARIGDDRVAVAQKDMSGHLFSTALDRSGRNWGFRFQVKDISDEFRARSGFVRRLGVTDFFYVQRLTFFGKPGALLESWGPFFIGNRIYDGRDFWDGEDPNEGSANLRMNFNLRGNNRVSLGYANRFFVLDPSRYRRYRYVDGAEIARTGEDAVFAIREMEGLDGFSAEVNSSYFKTLSAKAEVKWEETPIFAEGTRGAQWSVEGEMGIRPTDALRLEATLRHARIDRQDGSFYSRATLPRLRVEYQLSRSIFLRAVGQYSLEEVDLLRAPDGTPYLYADAPLRIRGGQLRAAEDLQTNPLRLDLLFSYQPSPGTVVFLGYGREMTDNEAFRFSPLEPRADGLFAKVSYLFRS
jgi:hypothetical protein